MPSLHAIPLPDSVTFEQGACLGIPGITAHQAVHAAGPVEGRIVLIQGGAGAVGQYAVALARLAGATVIATVRSERNGVVARSAGATHVVYTGGLGREQIVERIGAHAPEGVDHVVEVAFDQNVWIDEPILRMGGSIAAFATTEPTPTIPFWPLLFKNIRIYLLGSDDFPVAAKLAAARALNEALKTGWSGVEIGARRPLESIARAHEAVERGEIVGRVVVTLRTEVE